VAWNYLDLADFLLIAEAVLGIPAEELLKPSRIDLAESALHAPGCRVRWRGVLHRPGHQDCGARASRVIRNHPLPDGNKRVGYLCALEFVARNGGTWTNPPDDPEGDITVAIIEGVAAGELSEEQLTDWVADRLADPES
jgi:death on curing protein